MSDDSDNATVIVGILMLCFALFATGLAAGKRLGVNYCVSRPIPTECIPTDTVVTPRGKE